jgi:hypothetical protein
MVAALYTDPLTVFALTSFDPPRYDYAFALFLLVMVALATFPYLLRRRGV